MDKYATRRCSATETIGELALRMKPAGLGSTATFATLVAADFEVDIEFTYTPGHAGNLDGAFEDAEEPEVAQLEITAIKAASKVHFDGDGMSSTAERGLDLTELFSGLQITALEDKLMMAKREEEI